MNITISKNELNMALSIAQSVVERKTTMPILSNVLLSSSEGKLKVSATDLEMTALINCNATVNSPGSTTVNARVFSDIVRELPDGDIEISVTEGERLEINAGSSHFKMVGVSAEEYPGLPGLGIDVKSKVNNKQFLEMVSKTVYSVSHDETRFNLNGVCFKCEAGEGKKEKGMLLMVATDGHRLALIRRQIEGLSFEGSAIVPTKGLAELKRVLDNENEKEIRLDITDGFFVVETSNAKIATRLIDGEFPDYNQVIPKGKGEVVRIKSDTLTHALRRAALMVSDKGKCVKMDFSPGKLRISSSSPELGESTEELEAEYSGEPISVGFNAKYILEFAVSIPESQRINLELNGELGPAKLYVEGDDSYFGIIMPMRLV